MKVKDFKNTAAGRRYNLNGCNDKWEVEHYTSISEYIGILETNGWNIGDIAEQLYIIMAEMYQPNDGATDFVLVIN